MLKDILMMEYDVEELIKVDDIFEDLLKLRHLIADFRSSDYFIA